jgi:hypothetical protein
MAGYLSGNEHIAKPSETTIIPLISPGNTSITNLYSGFPNGFITSNNWENPSPLGYLENGTDIANKVKGYYIDYDSSVQDTYTDQYPPAWCTRLKVIAISGGGGGGSGGANKQNYDAGCGGSGAGGNMAIMVSKIDIDPLQFKYSVYFTAGGSGGAYQGTAGAGGSVGSQGTAVEFDCSTPNSAENDYVSLTVYGGGGGGWGPGTDENNNDSNGGQNNVIYNNNSYGNSNNNINAGVKGGNNTTVAYGTNIGGNFANYFNFTGNSGNSGAGGGNSWVGYSGVVANYNSNNDPPPLNSNIDYSSNGNKAQYNSNNVNTEINNQPYPPVGQGGVGGWNSSNGNGYPGQQGGPAQVRVYFLA